MSCIPSISGLFGRSVAKFLRKLPEGDRIPAQIEISMVMQKYKTGQQLAVIVQNPVNEYDEVSVMNNGRVNEEIVENANVDVD